MPAQWVPESSSERDTPSVLLRLALWSSLTSNHLVSLMNIDKNRIRNGIPSGIPRIKEAWAFFTGSEGRGGMLGGKSWGGGAF